MTDRIPPQQVTLVIEGWNADDLESREIFERALHSLQQQTYPIAECTLYVVLDAQAHAEGSDWVQAQLPRSVVLPLHNQTYYRSKNLGIQQARTEYLVFADSDVIYAPEWLESLLGCFAPGIDLVAGNTRYEEGPFRLTLDLVDWAGLRIGSGFTAWFYANSVAMRQELYSRLRFREDFGLSGGGAVNALRAQLRSEGVRPWFCEQARGQHSLAPFWPKRLRIGAYHLRTRQLASDVEWAWVARVPLLAPFLVVGGTLLRAWQRAWRLRSLLPGRGFGLPIYMISIGLVKLAELAGAILYALAPGYVDRKHGWFDIPQPGEPVASPESA